MPQRIAVELKCARCGRVWFQDYDPKVGKVTGVTSIAVTVTENEKVVKSIDFDALCEPCTKAVANYVSQLDKVNKASPERESRAKRKEGTPAEPAPPPPAAAPSTPVRAAPAAGPPPPDAAFGKAGASAPVPSTGPTPPPTARKT